MKSFYWIHSRHYTRLLPAIAVSWYKAGYLLYSASLLFRSYKAVCWMWAAHCTSCGVSDCGKGGVAWCITGNFHEGSAASTGRTATFGCPRIFFIKKIVLLVYVWCCIQHLVMFYTISSTRLGFKMMVLTCSKKKGMIYPFRKSFRTLQDIQFNFI